MANDIAAATAAGNKDQDEHSENKTKVQASSFSPDELLSKSRNGANRCKWLFGLFAGLLAIISNNLFDSFSDTKKVTILFTLIGVVFNAFAVVNFEKLQFKLERDLVKGEISITQVTPEDEKVFSKSVCFMMISLGIGALAGLIILISLFWHDVSHLLHLLFNHTC